LIEESKQSNVATLAVSIKDLEEVAGLKSGSIYNRFGDKAGIFSAACLATTNRF
jgi:AcrR family transcriptional regulator